MKEVKTPKKPLAYYYGIVLIVLIVFNLVVAPILMAVSYTHLSAGYQIPVLMITAKGSFDDMRQGFLSGSDDYMVKPEMCIRDRDMILQQKIYRHI